MPTYSIDGPDGKSYSIDGPAGATRDQVIAKIKEKQQSATPTADNRGPVDKLFGIGGERYQTWPEKLVRSVASGIGEGLASGANLTKEAITGDPQYWQDVQDPAKVIPAASLGVTGAPEAAELAGGVVDAASKAKQIRAALPATDEIKKSAQTAYKAVQDARLIASEGSINGLVSATRAGLDQRLLTDVAPRTMRSLEQLQKSGGDISGILGVRQRLGEISPEEGADFTAAQHVRDAIDNYIETLPPTEIVQGDAKFTQAMLEHARASWKSYAQSDQIESALQIGQHKASVAGTGANTQNAMRQRIREILDSDKKSRGFSSDAKQQMEDIVTGTWLTNAARYAGKFAPSGPVSAMTTMGAALMGDLGSGAGMASIAAAGVAIPATIAKYLGTYLTKNQIWDLENIIRAESPLGQAAVSDIKSQSAGMAAQALTASTPALVPGAASALAQPGQ